jgi:thiamine pyrophosphate-dependent acetolactate synthase large subunit-like protein
MVTSDTAQVRQRSGAAIVEALKAEGVEHIFGLVG